MDDILNRLLLEEAELQFSGFNEDTAWEIGNDLMKRAVAEKLSITIDITRGEHQVFHASRPGTSVDNDQWVKRKTRLVYRFGHSSFYVGQLLKSMGKSLEEVFLCASWWLLSGHRKRNWSGRHHHRIRAGAGRRP
jgi:uncharacterized protein (UPF0303 family)